MADFTPRAPLEVQDFSGGKTDSYKGAASNKFEDADNCVIVPVISTGQKIGKLKSRPGSQLNDTSYPRVPANARVTSLVDAESTLFQHHGQNLYYVASGWQTLTGPSGNAVFS